MRFDAPLPSWWRDVFQAPFRDPDTFAAEIVGFGEGGLRAVCAVFDPDLGERPVPRPTPESREFCALVLSQFAGPEIAPWIVAQMRRLGGDDPATLLLADALAVCGPAAVGAACAWFAETEPGDAIRPCLAEVAAHGGARSDEALAVLVRYLMDDPIHAAQLLDDYGDPAAAPALRIELDRTESEGPDADPQVLVTLGTVLRRLGGELDPARKARLESCDAEARDAAIEQRRRFIERGGFGGPVERPDDGDACPCDSGRTYIDCCAAIEDDLAERHRLRRQNPSRY